MAKSGTFIDLPRAVAAEQHAVKRLFNRFGICLTRTEYRELSAACTDGRAPPVYKGQSGGTMHCVSIHGRKIWVIYRPDVAGIVTFLPGIPREAVNADAAT